MNIYIIEASDGYYSRILLHDEKFTKSQFNEMLNEDESGGLKSVCEHLIKHHGFKSANYMTASVDYPNGVEERKW